MDPIVCTINANIDPRVTPDLPGGLIYSITSSGSQRTVTISGTPVEGLEPRLFYIGYNAYISTVQISGRVFCRRGDV